MSLLILGINHKTAPVDIRERVAFGPDIVVAALRSAVEKAGVDEIVVLSTCNRTEIYAAGDPKACIRLRDWVGRFHGLDPSTVAPFLYEHQDRAAVAHLMAVASGLDSLIVTKSPSLESLDSS